MGRRFLDESGIRTFPVWNARGVRTQQGATVPGRRRPGYTDGGRARRDRSAGEHDWFPISQSLVQFDSGAGLEELIAAWPFLFKEVRIIP